MPAKVSLTPAQQKQILFGILGLIGFFAWLQLFLFPQRAALAQARAQIQELRGQVEQVRAGLAQQPAMEEETRRLQAEYKLPEVTKPPEQQLPELLELISQVARQAGVRVVAAKPKGDVSKLLPGASGYLELPVLVLVSGGYHQIGQFLDALEQSETLLRVRELSVMDDEEKLYEHTGAVLFQAYLVPARPKQGA